MNSTNAACIQYFLISWIICINDAVGDSVNPPHTATDGENILLGNDLQAKRGSAEVERKILEYRR